MDTQEMKGVTKNYILSESKKGNIVILTGEGLQVGYLKEVVNQHIDGLLYDLNRSEVVVLTLIDDPKWINDYAMVQVIRELKKQLEEANAKNEALLMQAVCTEHEWTEVEYTTSINPFPIKSVICRKCGKTKNG
jgi:hypothetical protein